MREREHSLQLSSSSFSAIFPASLSCVRAAALYSDDLTMLFTPVNNLSILNDEQMEERAARVISLYLSVKTFVLFSQYHFHPVLRGQKMLLNKIPSAIRLKEAV